MEILIVDDSPDDALLLKTFLTNAGYGHLHFASSGQEAIRLLETAPGSVPSRAPYDLILMDIMMPGLSGIETLQHIKSIPHWRQTPVVMVTGQTDLEHLSTAFSAGAVDYITKPIRKVEMLARIRSIVALSTSERLLRQSEQRMRDMTAALDEGLLSLCQDGTLQFLNPSGARLLGLEGLVDDPKHLSERSIQYHFSLSERPTPSLLHEEKSPTFQTAWQIFEAILNGEINRYSGETLFRRMDSTVFPVSFSTGTIREENGLRNGCVITFKDITARRKSQERLRLAASIIKNTREGVTIVNADDSIITDINPAFTQITGYPPEEAIGQKPSILKSGRHDAGFYQKMWTALINKDHWQGEVWNRRKSGELYPQWLSITAIRDERGQKTHYVGLFSDITNRKLAEQKLIHMAHHDLLTGLPNRLLLLDRLHRAAANANRNNTTLALLYLDLDRFKPINDTHGHQAGDTVLRSVARRLCDVVRKSDTAARVGGDEFVVLLEDAGHRDDATQVAEKIIDSLSQPIVLENGAECQIGTSIGISLFPNDALDPETLIQRADLAMYNTKESGRMGFQLYDNLPESIRSK
ncbi:MAG: diguanylate cyclase [Magnetococcales bacterium]|nr:diguanylate cyclase [Magnetococcales bacterium]